MTPARKIVWRHGSRPAGPILMWLTASECPAARLQDLLNRIPNLPREGWMVDARCKKCGAENVPPRKEYIRLVKDERGWHYECSVCAFSWSD